MSDDLLKRATQALRTTTDAPNPRASLTRARVLESSERRYRVRAGWPRFALMLAALFTVGTAMARFQVLLPKVREALGLHAAPQPTPLPRGSKRVRSSSQATRREQPSVKEARPNATVSPASGETAPQSRPATATHSSRLRAHSTPLRVTHTAPAVPEPNGAAAVPEPECVELALFRRAQALHLARDLNAVAAWEAYLRVADQGALVPEAEYNRALCLVRLGRREEARVALEPFARGELHGYRRAEAQALLGTLTQ